MMKRSGCRRRGLARAGAWLTAGAVGVAAGFVAAPVVSHHSFAMYDQQAERTLTGKLTRFVPGANHAQLIFQVLEPDGTVRRNENGDPMVWGVETGPAARIAQQGVTVDAFPGGTILTVTLHPLRDGRPFGSLVDGGPLIKCGTTLPEDGCTEETGEVFLAE